MSLRVLFRNFFELKNASTENPEFLKWFEKKEGWMHSTALRFLQLRLSPRHSKNEFVQMRQRKEMIHSSSVENFQNDFLNVHNDTPTNMLPSLPILTAF